MRLNVGLEIPTVVLWGDVQTKKRGMRDEERGNRLIESKICKYNVRYTLNIGSYRHPYSHRRQHQADLFSYPQHPTSNDSFFSMSVKLSQVWIF